MPATPLSTGKGGRYGGPCRPGGALGCGLVGHEQRDDADPDVTTQELARLLALAVSDLVDRVAPSPRSRLVGRPPELGGRTRADAVYELAQRLADVAAGVENRDAGRPAPRRTLPDLGPFVVADQLAVTGADLLAAVLGRAPASSTPAGGTPGDLDGLLTQCREAVEALRSCI